MHWLNPDLPQWFLALAGALFGVAIGSFLNVVIHRVPRDESVVGPGSHCPLCGAAIRVRDNIPVVSFILLRGRCRDCKAHIAFTYPVIEAVTAAVFAVILARRGASIASMTDLIMASILIALTAIDARHRLLPDRITYPLLLVAITAAAFRGAGGASDLDPHVSLTIAELEFSPHRAALIGGAMLLGAVPALWFIDFIDILLFSKYLDWEDDRLADSDTDLSATMPGSLEQDEEADYRRYRRTLGFTSVSGALIALIWVIAIEWAGPGDPERWIAVYDALGSAAVGALAAAAPLWLMRTAYFYIRGIEGLGLGDVKMMAGVGAYFGWAGALGAMLLGSFGGIVLGIILARRSGEGLQTSLPLGSCLGVASIFLLVVGIPAVY